MRRAHHEVRRVMPPATATNTDRDGGARPPLLLLPGFQPDAFGFATRTTLSLLLAYLAAFAVQVDGPSTAGVCVAIVAQPSPGMAMSKAAYRLLGTLLGGCVGLALLAAFPQDRVLLLAGYAVWLGLCTFGSTLLRDFRSYGAALSGYTAGIIAIGAIDSPDAALLTTMNRVAAMTIGIAAVFVVNNLFAGTDAVDSLVTELRERTDAITSMAAEVLEGRRVGDDLATLHVAAGAAALHAQTTYAVRQLPDGRIRSNAAHTVIAALLAMVSAARGLGRELGPETPAAVRKHLDAVAAAIRHPTEPRPVAPWPTRPGDALVLQCADELLMQTRRARIAQDVLVEGKGELPAVRLRASHDVPGALLAGCRSMLAVGLGSLVCIYSGWSGATLVLIMQSACTALLAQAPNPRAASLSFVVPLLPMALVIGVVEFILLPNASGFVPFAAALVPVALATALLTRVPLLASFAPVAFLYVPLFLAPSNAQTYYLVNYCNTVMQVGVAVLLTVLSFDLVFRVSPSRRFYRVAAQLAADLRRTLRRHDRLFDEAPAQSLLFDRMMSAMTWMGRATPARVRLLHEMYGIGEVDLAIRRARTGLAQLQGIEPRLVETAAPAVQALKSGDGEALLRAGQAMLDHPSAAASAGAVRQVVSAMASAARLIGEDHSARRLYRRLTA